MYAQVEKEVKTKLGIYKNGKDGESEKTAEKSSGKDKKSSK